MRRLELEWRMAESPLFKVYNAAREYRASCKAPEECAVLVAFLGNGATIRAGHSLILWTEGQEECPAAESYDRVAECVNWRLDDHRAKQRAKTARRIAEFNLKR